MSKPSNGHGEPSALTLRRSYAPGPLGDGAARPGDSGPDLRRQRPPGPSTHLALIVVGIAAVLMILGSVASGLAGGGSKPAPASTAVPTAKGSPLRAVSAGQELSPVVSDGLPPADVLAAVALPAGTTAVPGSALSNGVSYYDHSLGFRVSASEQDVIDFFRDELPALRWHLLSQGLPSSGRGYQILGQHPGSDGYEWELGVTVGEETFPPPSGGTDAAASTGGTGSSGAGAAGTTPFTIRLFEVTDDQ